MDPDRLGEIAKDEQRAVEAVNDEYLHMQDHVPELTGEGPGHPHRRLRIPTWALALVLFAALGVLMWWVLGAI